MMNRKLFFERTGWSAMVWLAVLCLSGCAGGADKVVTTAKIVPVKVITIGLSAMSNSRTYVGTVEESAAVALSFATAGTVKEVFVAEGQKVEQGQLLATLDGLTAQSSADAAQATLFRAQDAYDRMLQLHENGSLPDIKWEEVRSGLQQAKSMAEIASKNLKDARLFAPRAGFIAGRNAEPGANVAPGMTVFRLVTVDRVLVKVAVPENEISRIAKGQAAVVEVSALGGKAFSGQVEQKGITANAISHTYEVKLGLSNPQAELLPGMACKVYLAEADSADEIIIPNRSVQLSHDGRHYVWLAEDETAHRRFVTVGGLSANGIVIVEGLSAGEQLIAEGYVKVSEGMQVKIVQ